MFYAGIWNSVVLPSTALFMNKDNTYAHDILQLPSAEKKW